MNHIFIRSLKSKLLLFMTFSSYPLDTIRLIFIYSKQRLYFLSFSVSTFKSYFYILSITSPISFVFFNNLLTIPFNFKLFLLYLYKHTLKWLSVFIPIHSLSFFTWDRLNKGLLSGFSTDIDALNEGYPINLDRLESTWEVCFGHSLIV